MGREIGTNLWVASLGLGYQILAVVRQLVCRSSAIESWPIDGYQISAVVRQLDCKALLGCEIWTNLWVASLGIGYQILAVVRQLVCQSGAIESWPIDRYQILAVVRQLKILAVVRRLVGLGKLIGW